MARKRGMQYIPYDYEAAYNKAMEDMHEWFIENLFQHRKKVIYALKEITAGDQFEIEIYPQFRSMDEVPPEGRTIKKDNNKAQKNLNDKNARKYVERLINENFSDRDIWMTLTYDDEHAVVHMDEDSPHMHVVGVPVGTDYKKGMFKQVSKRKVFTKDVLSIVLQDKLRAFANERARIVLGEQIREKSKGRNRDLSVMEYKVLKEEIRYDELKEQDDEKQQENEQLEREKKQLVHEYDTLSMRVAVKQLDYEEADERVKEANERADRIEAYIKTQSDTLVDLEEKATKLERKAEIAEQVYEMACGSGGNEALREKLIDVMYENEQLKAENSKLRETLNKAYDFMKQFVVDGRNLLERFLESIGQVVEKARSGFRR